MYKCFNWRVKGVHLVVTLGWFFYIYLTHTGYCTYCNVNMCTAPLSQLGEYTTNALLSRFNVQYIPCVLYTHTCIFVNSHCMCGESWYTIFNPPSPVLKDGHPVYYVCALCLVWVGEEGLFLLACVLYSLYVYITIEWTMTSCNLYRAMLGQ